MGPFYSACMSFGRTTSDVFTHVSQRIDGLPKIDGMRRHMLPAGKLLQKG